MTAHNSKLNIQAVLSQQIRPFSVMAFVMEVSMIPFNAPEMTETVTNNALMFQKVRKLLHPLPRVTSIMIPITILFLGIVY